MAKAPFSRGFAWLSFSIPRTVSLPRLKRVGENQFELILIDRIPPRIIEPASTILPHFLDHEEALKQGHNVFPFSWHSQKS
jgi:hypothetical protein